MRYRLPALGRRRRRLSALAAALVFAGAATLVAPPGTALANPCPDDEPDCHTTTPAPDPPTTPPTAPGPRPLHIVWMGDSFSSGEGMAFGHYPQVPGSNPPREDWRHQTTYAPGMLSWYYLEMARKPGLFSTYTVGSPLTMQTNWGTDHMDFVASSGADTWDIWYPQHDDESGADRQGPQADALNSGTDLVGFGFGGNDAHYATLFKTAIEAYGVGKVLAAHGVTTWQNYQAAKVDQHVQDLLAGIPTVTQNLVDALTYTSMKADHAQIVVSLYPQALKPSGNPSIPFVSGAALDKMYAFQQALNDAVRTAVTKFQAQHPNGPVIQVFDPNSAGPGGSSVIAGHEVGQPQSYFNNLVISNKSELLNGHPVHGMQESFHPNQLGGVAMGQALATFLHAKYPQFWPDAPAFPKVFTNPQPWPSDPDGDRALNDYIDANLQEFCSNAGYPDLCINPGNGGGTSGGGTDPAPTDDAASMFEWELDLWMLHAWASIQDGGDGSGNEDSGSSSGTTGDAIDTFAMLEGHWVHIYTDDHGVIHQDPMPPDFVPPPNKISPGGDTPGDDTPTDPDDPGNGGGSGGGDDGSGTDDGGYGDPGDGGWGDWGDTGGDGWGDWAGGDDGGSGDDCNSTAGYTPGRSGDGSGTVLVSFLTNVPCDDDDGSMTA
jgi:hypothetical protein